MERLDTAKRRRRLDLGTRTSGRPLLMALVLALLALSGADPTSAKTAKPMVRASQRILRGPAPAWVAPRSVDDDWRAPDTQSADGVDYLLVDRQLNATGKALSAYYRTARVITSATGLSSESRIELSWNPAFETLTLHRLQIRRDGTVIDRLQDAHFEVLRRESSLDDDIVDGTLSAITHLEDLRVGDVLDVAFSRTGENAVFEGRRQERYAMGWVLPAHDVQLRVLWPAARPFAARAIDPHGTVPKMQEQRTAIGARELRWSAIDVAPIRSEGDLPWDYALWPSITIGDEQQWTDIVTWGLRLHDLDGDGTSSDVELPPWYDQQLDQWRSLPSTKAKALAASNFARAEIRYVGLEMGEQSHRPRPIATVLRRRYGDCKDQSLLLTHTLRQLGIPAWTVLIHTQRGRTLDDDLPAGHAFNHVIVAAQLGDDPDDLTWIDPTDSERRDLATPRFERGLVLRDGETGPRVIPIAVPPEPTEDVEERWLFSTVDNTAHLRVTSTWRGVGAEYMRRQLASESREQIAANYLNFYIRTFDAARAVAPLEVQTQGDDVVVIERYTIDDAWKTPTPDHQELSLPLGTATDVITLPSVRRRTQPLGLSHPVNRRHTLRLLFATAPGAELSPDLENARVPFAPHEFEAEDIRIEPPAFRFRRTVTPHPGGEVVIEAHYESRRDRVDADDVAEVLAKFEEARDLGTYEVQRPTPGYVAPPPSSRTLGLAMWMLGWMTAFATIGVGAWSLGPRRMPVTTPSSPLRGWHRAWPLLAGLGLAWVTWRLWVWAPQVALSTMGGLEGDEVNARSHLFAWYRVLSWVSLWSVAGAVVVLAMAWARRRRRLPLILMVWSGLWVTPAALDISLASMLGVPWSLSGVCLLALAGSLALVLLATNRGRATFQT